MNTCRTCRHWGPWGGWHLCGAIDSAANMPGDGSFTYEEARAADPRFLAAVTFERKEALELVTHETFGCVLWEPKENHTP